MTATPSEVATVCNDGFVGLSLVLAGKPSPYQAIVQLPGAAYGSTAKPFTGNVGAVEDLHVPGDSPT
jgi:hypothetical protein